MIGKHNKQIKSDLKIIDNLYLELNISQIAGEKSQLDTKKIQIFYIYHTTRNDNALWK